MAESSLGVLTVVWAVVTTVLVGVLIYRALLSMKEDDQLFLDPAQSHLEKEQLALQGRLTRLSRYALIMGLASVVLLLVIAGMWTYEQFTRPPIA
jgi:hypothetical protein